MSKENQKKRSFIEKQATKKAAVLESGRKKRNLLPILLIPICAAVLFFVGFNLFGKIWKSPQSVALAKRVTHPVKLFEDGKARHFQVDTGDDISIRYFVLKSSDGVIRAAFDACDVCWRAGKGYYQEGDNMVCRNCGKRFASVKVNEVRGGCNPAPLERHVEGENLVILVKDILAGKRYFDFKRG
ncbi:MAG: DUF2318 domain-containing protein [Deltaproteobacteria bacterium]|nr:DUF2318 domain-containing protein [Deltaproteobacteria bacterium]